MKIKTEKQKRFVQLLEEIESGSALKFFKNCDNPDKTLEYIEDSHSFRRILGVYQKSFMWAYSEEGSSYWGKIWTELQERER